MDMIQSIVPIDAMLMRTIHYTQPCDKEQNQAATARTP